MDDIGVEMIEEYAIEGKKVSECVMWLNSMSGYERVLSRSIDEKVWNGVMWKGMEVIEVKVEYSKCVLIVVNENRELNVFESDENGWMRKCDCDDVNENGIIDLSDSGDRFEGCVRNDSPFGYGSLYDDENRLMYEGFMIDDMKVCFGIEYYSDLGLKKYEGHWFDGMKCGYGKLFDRNGCIAYEGNWFNDQPISISTSTTTSLTISDPSSLIPCTVEELSIADDCCNDESITSFTLYWLYSLRILIVGDYCFKNVTRFDIDGLNRLESIKIGEYSFSLDSDEKNREFHLKNCSNLKSLVIDDYSFRDYYVMELNNLPKLQSIKIGIGNTHNANCFRYVAEAHFIGI